MRSTLAICLMLVGALEAIQAEPPSSNVELNVRTQANTYANQMMETIRDIQAGYYRKVTSASLVESAIVGLYEVARAPLPSGLKSALARAESDDDYRALLVEARERLGNPDNIQGQKSIFFSMKALTRVLDPYSGFPGRNDARRAFTSSPGIMGIGVELESDAAVTPDQFSVDYGMDQKPQAVRSTGPTRIVDVLPGSPAQQAGLRPGDVIMQIDGRELNSLSASQIVPKLNMVGTERTMGKVALTIRRPARADLIHVQLTPTLFRPETVFGVRRRLDQMWDYWLNREERVAYVRLGYIDSWSDPLTGGANGGTDQELRGVLTDLQRSGMKGLVLDLRGCPGGFITPAVNLIGLFARDAVVASVRSSVRKGAEETRYTTPIGEEPLVRGVPIIVLVNEDTIGGGELIAAALRDNRVGEIAGQRTFGKGSVQSSNPLRNSNVTFKLTTGLIYRPNGKPLQRMPDAGPKDSWGVSPDPGLEIPMTPELNKQLKSWMQMQILRPGDSREVLPLDDPENDPARQFAYREVLKRINAATSHTPD